MSPADCGEEERGVAVGDPVFSKEATELANLVGPTLQVSRFHPLPVMKRVF
jgi:hypothetical protein